LPKTDKFNILLPREVVSKVILHRKAAKPLRKKILIMRTLRLCVIAVFIIIIPFDTTSCRGRVQCKFSGANNIFPMTIHQELIDRILSDNDIFVQSHDPAYFQAHAHGQSPRVTMLTCSDSRVCSRILSQESVNNVFVIRNIGNQVSTCEGSLDYAVYHLKTPLLVIVGHSDCGAIKARMKGVMGEPDTIRRELLTLPACPGGPYVIGDNEDQLLENIFENIRYQVRMATVRYARLIKNDELRIVGVYYDFHNDLGQGWGRVVVV